MKKFRFFSIVLCIAMFCTLLSPTAFALSAPELDGQAALVVDLDSGRFLYAMNAEQQRAPASLTKIMTVLLALEAVDRGDVSLTDVVTAQQDCREGLGEDSSSAGIIPGVQLSLRELMLHEPLLGNRVAGNSSSIKSISDSLLETKKKMNQILSKHTGRSEEEVEKATSFDHYYSPEESKEFGLCDDIVDFNTIMEG